LLRAQPLPLRLPGIGPTTVAHSFQEQDS
jgi:hypothetical protein